MANLIITVIAIALVAIASLMGAYYGGAAFLNNQSAANASTVLNEGQQLAGAWNAYLADNLNQAPPTETILVTNNYLAQLPKYPAGPGSATGTMGASLVGGRYLAYADMGAGAGAAGVIGTTADSNSAACSRIIKTAVGGTANAYTGNGTLGTVAPGAIYNGIGTSGNGTFGCAYVTAAIATTLAPVQNIAGNHYVMEYLLQ